MQATPVGAGPDRESGRPLDSEMHPEPLLDIRRLSKTFEGVTVVRDVRLKVRSGAVHGLVGQNGCGKSTVIKVLSGFHSPDAGSEIYFKGEALRHMSGDDGLAFVHQDLALVGASSVLENLALVTGYRTARLWRVRWREERRRCRELIAEFGIRGDPDMLVNELGTADRTLLAIARGLARVRGHDQSLLVLDEPTSSLTLSDVTRVLGEIRRVSGEGSAVIFVSHRLGEVLSVCDEVHIMRDGQIVAEMPAAELNEDQLVELMLGRTLAENVPTAPTVDQQKPVLSVKGLGGRRLRDVSFDLRPGQILGVTGLVGSGKTELGRVVFGAEPIRHGEIWLDGERIKLRSPADAIRAGIGYVPPERRTQGGIAGFTATENVTLPELNAFWKRGLLRRNVERQETRAWMHRTNVVPSDPDREFATFSGGNQQKLVFSKWIRLNPKVLILDEPSQGVDVGATRDLYSLAQQAAANGLALLLLSSEWEDMARLCHRVIVLDRGVPTADIDGADLTHDRIAAAVFGGSSETNSRRDA